MMVGLSMYIICLWNRCMLLEKNYWRISYHSCLFLVRVWHLHCYGEAAALEFVLSQIMA